ncbi:hypothetical protein COU62_01875 [Candidatus Pacearchaeota archaeon CG10_big_fil_rev_8_21_14_0_10_35_219]|nr:hypothetical protein [Candidatus Pacearchaeota archaeon]OIO42547.1 MAG: hypothetical protein AUJ63_02585 [Candidatus Pacearchaeota archaeon CG1_02_35_32]PIO07940.1 MAG: hypothetical protein COU62_01875 [Candidatus Pacearchaeota archaeon CG10_big_fil_rev_8_21_14_0_10_35_219]PIY81395.1 MAG: hypothetical protein COY79_02685 [Candidatus Pacearchaeota archaeon CG_4_10_14_0_8_um_filter_35_169]PIZ80641.1 MAG: hypothetical protein COY00_00760 [Candidatus Pacearchaeota archaeon CG_4_10_14_0_2_um_filt
MEQKYELQMKKEETIDTLRDELVKQRQSLKRRIKRLDDQENRNQLMESLRKIHDISASLIPLQESLNLVWKRTQQIEEEIKEVLDRLS